MTDLHERPAPFAAHLIGTEPAPFDWPAWSARQDAMLDQLQAALARWHDTERALDETRAAATRGLMGEI